MRREELEHVIRAAGAASGERELIVVGSAALLASIPEPPDDLAQTRDVDLFSPTRPEASDLISGAIGELSPFHQSFDVYAQGVGPDTAILPEGWRDRLVVISTPATGGTVAYCLEPHDLALSKLAAGREKDHEFVRAMLRHHIVGAELLVARLPALPVASEARARLEAWITTHAAARGTQVR